MENGNKPAHPTGQAQSGTGLTKREYFAGLAMQGIISNSNGKYYEGNSDGCYVPSVVAKDAIAHADELLKQLENEK